MFDRLPKEKNEEREEDFDEVARAACEDVAEREEGVDAVEAEEGEGICNRLNEGEGGLRLVGTGFVSSSSSSSSSTSSSSSMCMASASSSVVSGAPVFCWLYCSHNSSTRVRLRGSRFSRLVERHSKQNKQYDVVAISEHLKLATALNRWSTSAAAVSIDPDCSPSSI